MYQESNFKLFKKYAVPQMIGLLLNSIYLIVDGIFIGNRLGRDSMAAAAVSVPVIEFFIAISMLVSSGIGIIISKSMGRGDFKKARRALGESAIFTLILCILIIVLGNVFMENIALMLGATEEIKEEALIYLKYILNFSAPLIFSFLLSGYVRNDNRPTLAMVALSIGSISNILLDYVFIYPLNMGIKGAALATGLGPVISVLILLPHFIKKKGNLYFEKIKFSTKELLESLKLGFPSFITEFSIGVVTFIYNFSIIKNGYGEIGLAAYLIIGYLSLIILTTFLGISQGIQPVFSYLSGKGDYKRINEIFSYFIKLSFVLGVILFAFSALFGGNFIKIFTENDTLLLDFTLDKIKIYFWGYAFSGVNIIYIAYYQSIGKVKKALFISFMRSFLFLSLCIFTLPLFFDREIIWFAYSFGELLTFLFRNERKEKLSLA